jgi:hypothetical protein
MKRVCTFVVAMILGVALATSEAPTASAQVPMCGVCCSQNGIPVCSGMWLLCGSLCTCAGVPGVGYAC